MEMENSIATMKSAITATNQYQTLRKSAQSNVCVQMVIFQMAKVIALLDACTTMKIMNTRDVEDHA